MDIQPKRKKTGGRTKGTLNKATAEVMAAARDYAGSALVELARLATGAENEATRVAAIKEILDRAYGKATQHVELEHGGEITLRSAAISAIDELLGRIPAGSADRIDASTLPN